VNILSGVTGAGPFVGGKGMDSGLTMTKPSSSVATSFEQKADSKIREGRSD
jgi:hypothetical protein